MRFLTETIEFPNLFSGDIEINRVAFKIGSFSVYWYGIIIAVGVALAFAYAIKRAKSVGLISEKVFDIAFIAIIVGFVGARLYFCLFYNLMNPDAENKYNLITMFTKIHDGGLAIYGGIIFGTAMGIFVSRRKKTPFLPLLDIAAPSFLIGQMIGRWGNFVNQECYGLPTAGDLPWGMTGSTIANEIAQDPKYAELLKQLGNDDKVLVHPCFLYESLWCFLGFLFIHFIIAKIRRFDGEIFLFYIMWYGAGRGWIEGLRTDSLYIGSVKISQAIAIASSVLALIMIIYLRFAAKKENKPLYVNTDISKEQIEEFEKKRLFETENAKAKKVMKQIEDAYAQNISPSILGDDVAQEAPEALSKPEESEKTE